MAKCEFCPEPATVHITDMKRGKYRELHLCEKCAEKEQSVKWQKQMSLEEYIKGVIAAYAGSLSGDLAKLECPHCGTKYMEFRAQGRLGCPADYTVFHKGLAPLLERIHGKVTHVGKAPRRGSAAPGRQSELVRLRRELQAAVAQEDYETAAVLRDRLREKDVGNDAR
jgi:protein arginine kinase activator